jgi:HEAT repeat protein
MTPKKSEHVPFPAVIAALIDEKTPFPPVYLHRLSDLSPENLKIFKAAWEKVSTERHFSLLEDLDELAEADTLLAFDEIARLALDDPDAKVREVAIRMLWECEDHKLIEPFIQSVETYPDYHVRAAAATALGLYVYLGELEELDEEHLKSVEDVLLKIYASEDHPLVRRRALESLGYSSREEISAIIEEAYQRGNPDWMVSALFAIGRSADNRWTKYVMESITHEHAKVREEAVRAAGELNLEEAREPLLAILEDDGEEDVQMAAVWSLSQIGGEGVRGAMEDLLENTDDSEISDFIENALDNLSFTEDIEAFEFMDFDAENDSDEKNAGSDHSHGATTVKKDKPGQKPSGNGKKSK